VSKATSDAVELESLRQAIRYAEEQEKRAWQRCVELDIERAAAMKQARYWEDRWTNENAMVAAKEADLVGYRHTWNDQATEIESLRAELAASRRQTDIADEVGETNVEVLLARIKELEQALLITERAKDA
jgi:hypothetical protein